MVFHQSHLWNLSGYTGQDDYTRETSGISGYTGEDYYTFGKSLVTLVNMISPGSLLESLWLHRSTWFHQSHFWNLSGYTGKRGYIRATSGISSYTSQGGNITFGKSLVTLEIVTLETLLGSLITSFKMILDFTLLRSVKRLRANFDR